MKPGRLLAYMAAHRRAVSTSVLNQGISSATNFALAFVLVRALSPADYGAYGLGIAVCYLYAGIGNSLFLIQMVVHTPERPPDDQVPFAVRTLCAVVLFALATLAMTGIGAWAAGALLASVRPYRGLAMAVAAASVCYVVKDFFVRQAYISRSESRALAVTLAIAAFLATLLGMARAFGVELTPASALVAFAAAQLAGAATGLVLARLPFRSFRWHRMAEDLARGGKDGRWATGSSVVGWAQSQAYAYLTVAVIGAAGVGQANAARLLVSPFLLLTPAINQITMPRLADMRVRDPLGMLKLGKAITLGLVALSLLYSLVLLSASDSLVPLLLGPRYQGMQAPLAAWCTVLVAMLFRDGVTTLFQAMRRFRALATVNVVSAAASMAAALLFMKFWGVTGAILGGAAGELTQAALLWRALRTDRVDNDGAVEATERRATGGAR